MLRARNAGEIAFWIWRAQPSAEIVRVDGAKCRGDCVLARSRVTLCGDRARRGREMQARLRFGLVTRNPLRKRVRFGLVVLHLWTKRSFWRLGASLLEEVSCETPVLETWRFTLLGGSLARNARFGDLALHFWRKSRMKRWFWRLGASLLEEVSYEMLVLETWRFTFGGSLVRNAHFADLALHLWSWTQIWPVCSANVARERAFRSWTQKRPARSANAVRERAPRSRTQKWPVCSANVVRETALRSWAQKWYDLLLVRGQTARQTTSMMSLCHADLRGLGGKCVCVAPCHWGARSMLA